MRVLITHDNRQRVANAVEGQAWADGVIVTQPDGTEIHVRVGQVLARRHDGVYVVLSR